MRRHKHPDRFFTGRHLWTCVLVTLALALDARAAASKECRGETPLPTDVRLVPAGQDVPETVARFAGPWVGCMVAPGMSDPRPRSRSR